MTSVAVIGAGHWGKNIIRVIHASGNLAAICDADTQKIEDMRIQYANIICTENVDTILNNSTIDAVMIATPSKEHFTLAYRALQAGKDVFVEKPMTLKVDEAQQLVDLAKDNNRIMMVGHVLQYHPAVVKIKELLTEGILGKLRYIHAQRLNFGKFRTEENSLWSFAPHDFSLALSMTGSMPTRVLCSGSATLSEKVADTTSTHLEFADSIHGYFYVSWLYPIKEQRFVVVGSKKMAIFDDCAKNPLVVYPYSVDWKESLPFGEKGEGEIIDIEDREPLQEECKHFLECVTSRNTPQTSGEEGLRVLRVLKACQDSLDTKSSVTL